MAVQSWLSHHFACAQLPECTKLPSIDMVGHLEPPWAYQKFRHKTVSNMVEVEGGKHVEMENGWDTILL